MIFSSLVLSLISIGGANGGYTFVVRNSTELINFADQVSEGNTYEDSTVLLESDIDLAGITFDPIGQSSSKCFRGTFDGQGHTVSNLVTNPSSQYTGLFGYSEGTTIRNVVLDSSCTLTNTHDVSSDYVYAGGIIGKCTPESLYSSCVVENSVNGGDITHYGNSDVPHLYAGGIAGYLSSSYERPSFVKNCVNYGSIKTTGERVITNVGGILGYSTAPIANCLNYGAISSIGATENTIKLGGIIGFLGSDYVDNCVNYGGITTNETGYVGAIAGHLSNEATVSHSYWNGDIKYDIFGAIEDNFVSECAKFNQNFVLNQTVSVGSYKGTALIEALNAAADYYALRSYSRWILNKNENDMEFNVSSENSTLILRSKIILLPSLANQKKMGFFGWYTDNAFTTQFTKNEITEDVKLYGKWGENNNNYTITFDTKGGSSIDPISAMFGSVVTLPSDLTKETCILATWETSCGDEAELEFTVPSQDVTLSAVWRCTHIKTVDDFIDFSKIVNKGLSTFEWKTVFLDSDIDFSGRTFEPIGHYVRIGSPPVFLGTFDGQGHTISNLVMSTSSLEYVGLFGSSIGTTVKNIVIDSSSSITSTCPLASYVGGIIGYCNQRSNICSIENCVNMASITSNGSFVNELHIGGISGFISGGGVNVKNCANYGHITLSGISNTAYIGGIVGFSNSIHNCLNYGTITYTGESAYSYFGGIIGWLSISTLDNCVNYGRFKPNNVTNTTYIGAIVGFYDGSTLTHCYWSDDNGFEALGLIPEHIRATLKESAKFNSDFVLNKTVTAGKYKGTSLIEALNAAADHHILRDYSRWVLNKNEKEMSFKVNGFKSFTGSFKIILLPSLMNEINMWFDGWYTDSACTTKFARNENTENTELFGKWEENNNKYTITFDTKGGSPIDPITAQFGSVVELPNTTVRDDCKLIHWVYNYADQAGWYFTVPAKDITLSAVWQCTRIKTADDLISFSKVVNWGISYFEGTTVFLDSDIEFNEELSKYFEPIGQSSFYFRGSFDGQNYVIRNLAIDASLEYVGVFGILSGSTIKNIILDSSCSVTSSYIDHTDNAVHVGGILGHCDSSGSSCIIENCVSKANVSFTGKVSRELNLGGIVGEFSYGSYELYIKNCTNYGAVTNYGATEESFIGGIVGSARGDGFESPRGKVYITNCTNYGNIEDRGKTSHLLGIDGIVGESLHTEILNCANHGIVSVASNIFVLSFAWIMLLMLLIH